MSDYLFSGDCSSPLIQESTRQTKPKKGAKTKSSWISPIFVNSGVFFPGENKRNSHRTLVPECPCEKFMNWPFFGLVCRGHSWPTLPECLPITMLLILPINPPKLIRSHPGRALWNQSSMRIALVFPRKKNTRIHTNARNLWTFRFGPFFGLVCRGDSWINAHTKTAGNILLGGGGYHPNRNGCHSKFFGN